MEILGKLVEFFQDQGLWLANGLGTAVVMVVAYWGARSAGKSLFRRGDKPRLKITIKDSGGHETKMLVSASITDSEILDFIRNAKGKDFVSKGASNKDLDQTG